MYRVFSDQLLFILIFIFCVHHVQAQNDSTESKLTFTGDFRFRIEQDWNSKKPDGSFRENKTRLRYRVRFGAHYQYNKWAEFGLRLRTGFPNKQQDPQLTLGDGFKEFGTLPVSFEKLYFQAKHNGFTIWAGKNTFPFEKQNELFWSDNVFPEGVFGSKKFRLKSELIQSLGIRAGHFILATSGTSLNNDRYVQGFQLVSNHWNNRLRLFPSLYYFSKMPNIPDGNDTFDLNYKIVHLGGKLILNKKTATIFEFDFYHNLEDYQSNDSIPDEFKTESDGYILALNFGKLEEKGDWKIKTTYTYLERFSAVDFLAQNDWARWDYSSFDSPDGRLTNFKGIEIMVGYTLSKKLVVNSRFFVVEQLVPFGIAKETGSRIRFDLDIGF